MTQVKDFNELALRLRTQGNKPRIVVVCPDDDHTRQVLERVLGDGIADVILVCGGADDGWADAVAERFDGHVRLVSVPGADFAAYMAVSSIRNGEADVLMKGRINTDNLLRAVLDKEHGLLVKGRVLTHLTVASIPSYSKLLLFSDAAVIPNPTLEQLEAIVSYGVAACRSLGIDEPRIALINCTEKVNDKFPVTHSYTALKQKAAEGFFGKVLVDGPMDVKTACDAESGLIKGLSSPVAGQADMLVFPDIQAGNTFYKTITLFAGASIAGMLCGTSCPVVLSSRADTVESKFNSIVLACGLLPAER